MTEPRWDDPHLKAGTMVRSALWLLQEVGEGNTFTKEQLRGSFPGVSQADRRVRDLREFGWVLDTSVTDASLQSDQQRFVSKGLAVWIPDERRSVGRGVISISSKERLGVLAAGAFQCSRCGIAGGESYPDRPTETAVLAVSRRTVIALNGLEDVLLVPECKKCRAGAGSEVVSVAELVAQVVQLDDVDLRRLRRWVDRGFRGTSLVDKVWSTLSSVSPETRRAVFQQLDL